MDEIWCSQCLTCQEHTFTACVCERDVHVEPPSELYRLGLVAKLNKTMYGTQDASNAWQKMGCEHLRSNAIELGASIPALYRSELVNGFCHGDDFVTAAAEDRLEISGKLLHQNMDTRCIGMIGAAEHLDKELEVLHRTVRVINSDLMEIEAFWRRCPTIRNSGLSGSSTGTRNTTEPRVETCLTQKVYEGRLRELPNIEKLEMAEPIQLQEATAQSLEIVHGKWLCDAKGTPEDPDAVRSRLVATQVNTCAREDVTQATPPSKASRIILSQGATKTHAKGQHDCLIARHDSRVAFFNAKGSGRVVIIPPRGLAPPGVGWRCVSAWHGTREASKCWGNEVTDTLINEGCKAVVVAPKMFVSENHGYVTVCH